MKSSFDIESTDKKIDIWRDLFNFYRQKTKVHLVMIDFSFETLAYESESVLVKEFLELYWQGSDEISIDASNTQTEMTENGLLKYDFVFRKNVIPLKKICEHFGVPFFSVITILDKWKRFSKTRTRVILSKNSELKTTTGWSYLRIPKQECNAMILSDNYIFSHESHIQNTLIALLKEVIIPKKIEIEFDLTIFSSKFYNNRIREDGRNAFVTVTELTEIYNIICGYLATEFSDVKINLTIVFKFLSEYHDRQIFTNNFFFKSGNSFTYFGENGMPILPSPTTLDIHPLTATNDNMTYFESYLILLKHFHKLMLKSRVNVGSGRNRLFEKLKYV